MKDPPLRNERDAWFLRRGIFAGALVLLFIFTAAFASYQGFIHFRHRLLDAKASNSATARLLSLYISEHQKAAVSLIKSYASRPLLVEAAKRRDRREAQRHLASLAADDPSFATVFIADGKGVFWASHPPRPESLGRNFSYRDWYQGVSRTWQPYISSVFQRITAEKDLAVNISVPIRDEKGRPIHILAATQRLLHLEEVIGRFPFEDYQEVVVIDGQGTVIFGNRYPRLKGPTPYPYLHEVQEALARKGQAAFSTGDEKRHLAAAKVEETSWTVVVETTEGLIWKAETPYFVFIGSISLLSFLLLAALSAYMRQFVGYRMMRRLLAAQKEAAERNRRYFSLLENVRMLAVGLDAEGKISYANPFLLELSGYEADEVLGEDFTSFVPEARRQEAEELFRRAKGGDLASSAELTILTKAGQERLAVWSNTILLDPDGGFAGTMSLGLDVTEHRLAEAALRESEERFRKAFTASPDSININRLSDGLFVEVNEGFTRLTGYTAEEVCGRTSLEIELWADRADRERLVAGLKERGRVDNLEARFRLKDGRIRTGLMSAIVISLKGEPHILSITRDIEEIKQAHEEIQRSREEAERLAEELTVIAEIGRIIGSTLEIDEVYERFAAEVKKLIPFDRIVITLNNVKEKTREVAYVWGVDIPGKGKGAILPLAGSLNLELIRTRRGFILHPQSPADLAESFPSAVSTVEAGLYSLLLVPLLSRGEVIAGLHLQAKARDFYSQRDLRVAERIGSQIAGAVANAELYRSLKKTEQERALLADTIAASLNEIYLFDARTLRFRFVNEGARRNLGYTPEEILRLTPLDLKPEFSEETFRRLLDPLLKKEKPLQVFETIHRRADGSLYPVEVHLQLHEQEEDKVFLAVIQDITERKGAEEEIRALNLDLERRVIERTAQLAAVNRELEAFSFSVSHDLRAPLRGILGFSQALLEDCRDRLDEAGRSYLERIVKAAQRMGLLIDDLLQLSRLARQEMIREKADLSRMIRSIAEDLSRTEPGRKVELIVQEGMEVIADPHLLRIAMENLLSNAWKFTGPKADPRVECGCRDDGGQRVFFVRDNGVGFEMAYADKLFQPFQRLHRQDDFPGTGIGLATVQRIIHRHGGRIWAEAWPGEGAIFSFVLPEGPQDDPCPAASPK